MAKKKFQLPKIHNALQIQDIKKEIKDLRKKVDPKKLTRKKLLAYAGKAAIAGGVIVVLLFAWYSKDLPTPQGIKRRLDKDETTKVYDRTGQHLLYAISGEQRRSSIAFSEMPENIKQAVIAIEDRDFYHHKGFYIRGIARSLYYDIILRQPAQGGSTITQQLVKNAIIRSSKKRLDRKIRELVLSLEIEAMYSKDKILELYLNEIPFGANAYGVEAASETFFGKKAKDLSLAEAATLAALPKAPSYYSPYGTHLDDLTRRRNLVLDKMASEHYITKEQATEAKTTKLAVIPRRDTILAPHFVMYVRDLIAEKYGEDIFTQGLTITTTLDIEQQKMAEQAVAEGAAANKSKYGIQNAALVSLNPKTGEVLAMVGSADYFDSEINGQFNVTTAKRQPGSAFKPIVYATAFKQKYNPAFILWDLPTDFNGYKPNNFDGRPRGWVSMRNALGQSLNISAVKTLALVGIKEALKTAGDLGITTLDTPDKYGLSLVLGAAEVRPIELAQAYGVFANRGVRQDISPIVKIEDRSGKVLEEFKPEDHKKQALDPQVAYEISDVLADQNAKAPVFGNLLSFGGRQVASKTGTTNGISNGISDVRDAWTVGYTPSLVTAIWVGNNDHSPLGKGVLAANAAVPIFKSYMNGALRSLASESFYRPPEVKTMTVDRLSNKLPTDASPPNEQVTDIFTAWQIPTKNDDIHVKVKLCKGTNQLATDETPASQIEEKYFVDIHSEKPNDPAWEGPVRAWADQNGLNNRPPTEKCGTFTADNRPQVSIVQPATGATVSGVFTVEASASSQFGISEVAFSIDDQSIANDPDSPYSISYDARNLTNGNHTVTAEAKDVDGRTSKASVVITVNKEATPPGDVNGVSVIPGKGQATINWINPADADLSRMRIYISEAPGEIGLRYSGEPVVGHGTATSVTIGGLTSGKTYYFTLHPVDTNNNENQSTTQYSGLVL